MPDRLHILLVGLATLDLHLQSFCMPSVDDHSYLKSYRFTPGGSALNMAFSLAQMGARVTLCTRIGKDFPGSYVRHFIDQLGIRLIAPETDTATGFSIINSNDEGRIGLAHFEGANDEIAPADVPRSEIAQHDVLHIGGALSMRSLDGEPLLSLLQEARSLGRIISMHASRNTDKKDLLLPSLPYLDFLFLNAKEAREITDQQELSQAAEWFRNHGVKTLAITLGSDGAFVSSQNFVGRIAAERVSALDTTGCGDAFTAGFLFALSRKSDIRECALWGNTVGGLCARSRGPLPHPFTLETVEALVSTGLSQP